MDWPIGPSAERARARSALHSLSSALPPNRITIGLTLADLPKEVAHFDLAIALAMLSAMEEISSDCLQETLAIGALSSDGRLNAVTGALPTALRAPKLELSLLCPQACGAEAAWVETTRVISADTLGPLIKHLNAQAIMSPAAPDLVFLQTQTCALATKTIGWLHEALDHFQLLPHGYHRMLRTARTIANLKKSDTIENTSERSAEFLSLPSF